MHAKFPVAVYLFLLQDDQVLLLRRYHTGYEDGKYSVIAGRLEESETVTQAIIREAKEEAGIDVHPDDVRLATIMHRWAAEGWVDFFFTAKRWSGEIINQEPDKCDELAWFPTNALPANMIPYVAQAFHNSRAGIPFEQFGW